MTAGICQSRKKSIKPSRNPAKRRDERGLKYAVDTFPFGRIARAANKSVIMIHENTHNCVIMALGI